VQKGEIAKISTFLRFFAFFVIFLQKFTKMRTFWTEIWPPSKSGQK
jgi:hypothetical protein